MPIVLKFNSDAITMGTDGKTDIILTYTIMHSTSFLGMRYSYVYRMDCLWLPFKRMHEYSLPSRDIIADSIESVWTLTGAIHH
jgi:hypothetical protein